MLLSWIMTVTFRENVTAMGCVTAIGIVTVKMAGLPHTVTPKDTEEAWTAGRRIMQRARPWGTDFWSSSSWSSPLSRLPSSSSSREMNSGKPSGRRDHKGQMTEIKQTSLGSQEVQMSPDLQGAQVSLDHQGAQVSPDRQGAQVSPDRQEDLVSPDRHLCMETDSRYQPTPPSSLHSFHQGHLHHNRKYLLREIWFRLGQLLHLLCTAPSPDSRILQSYFSNVFRELSKCFFFFSWCFLEKPFSSNREWTQTTTDQALLTQELSGERGLQAAQAPRGLKTKESIIRTFSLATSEFNALDVD